MDDRENDTVIKKMFIALKNKNSLTDEEHQRAMSSEFDYLDESEDEDDHKEE